MKVLHLPDASAGFAWQLSHGEKSLGLNSEVLIKNRSLYGYPADEVMNVDGSKLDKFAQLSTKFWKIRNSYDVFHFNMGTSLLHFPHLNLNHLELPFYPKNKPLFVTYNGCDARQKFPTMKRALVAACHESECYGGQCNTGELDEQRRAGIDKMSRYVSHMWAVNPDLLHFLPSDRSSFLPYPILERATEYKSAYSKKRLRIVHAPTNRAAKGSVYVLDALSRIQRDRPDEVEVILVEGKTHLEALAIYESADLIIDQILIGWYGGFAVETMHMGKPVIVRVAEEDLKFIPPQMSKDLRETILNADPSSIYSVICRALDDREDLVRRSQASREYAHRWHSPSHVAAITKERYQIALDMKQ